MPPTSTRLRRQGDLISSWGRKLGRDANTSACLSVVLRCRRESLATVSRNGGTYIPARRILHVELNSPSPSFRSRRLSPLYFSPAADGHENGEQTSMPPDYCDQVITRKLLFRMPHSFALLGNQHSAGSKSCTTDFEAVEKQRGMSVSPRQTIRNQLILRPH
jgi:hypothetical protein